MIPLIEILTNVLPQAVLLFLLISTIYSDIKYKKIFNRVTFPAIILGLILSFVSREVFITRLYGFLLGFSIFLVPFLFSLVGAGDLKLVSAIGILKGSHFVVDSIVGGIMIAGIYAIMLRCYRGEFLVTIQSIFSKFLGLGFNGEKNDILPLGAFISIWAFILFLGHQIKDFDCLFLSL